MPEIQGIDLSLVISGVSLAIAILTLVYLMGKRIGSSNEKLDSLEQRVTLLTDRMDGLNAQFGFEFAKEYGDLRGQVRQLSQMNFEQIVRDLLSRIHSSLEEVARTVFSSIGVKIHRIDLAEELTGELTASALDSRFVRVTDVSDIKRPVRILALIDCEVDERYRVEVVAIFNVNREGTVAWKSSEITEIQMLKESDLPPAIRTRSEARTFTASRVEYLDGYLGSILPILAAVLSHLLKREKRD